MTLNTFDSHPDVGYRIYLTNKINSMYTKEKWINTPWFTVYKGAGGDRGVYTDINSAKRSAKSYGFNKYEIWKFRIGLPNSEVPFFPPTKVYEQ